MKIGLTFPSMPEAVPDVRAYARWVREHPGTMLWLGHSTLLDSSILASYLAGSGIRIPVGFGVSLIPLMHPMHAASIARSVSVLNDRPVAFGVGISSQEFVASVRGEPYQKPATATTEYLRIMRAALQGEPFQFQGEQFEARGSINSLSSPRVEVGAGVLRPAMAQRVGPDADFVITWLCPPSYVADVIAPCLPSSTRLVTSVQFLLDTRPIDPNRAMAEINVNHVRAPHYREMLQGAGVVVGPADSPEMIAQRSVEADVFMYGSVQAIAGKLRGLASVGVDEVVLNPAATYLTYGADAALQDVSAVVEELGGVEV